MIYVNVVERILNVCHIGRLIVRTIVGIVYDGKAKKTKSRKDERRKEYINATSQLYIVKQRLSPVPF